MASAKMYKKNFIRQVVNAEQMYSKSGVPYYLFGFLFKKNTSRLTLQLICGPLACQFMHTFIPD